jgi:formate hydrogenlyase subunit 3/multisubunit Na+/H+ antiporter MnhD subunit
MHELLYPILVPAIAGIIPIFIPRKGKMVAGIIALVVAVWMFVRALSLFGKWELAYNVRLFTLAGILPFDFSLRLYHFSAFVLLFIMLFGVLVILYSLGFLRGRDTSSMYYSFILWTLAAAAGAVISDNLLVLLIFWEMLTVILFFLINMGDKGHEKAAAKTFTILGLTDALMLLAVALIWSNYGTLQLSRLSISTGGGLGVAVFLMLFVGAIAKAGAMPLHSWIPEMAKPTLAPVVAFLPASLDKLLGIYLLARIVFDIFIVPQGSPLSIMMMIVGAATILFAVLMALVQHDLKKLLSFHAVSQVGYMVLGVGSGIPIAMVGGLFHMLNHAIYKSALFLGAGAVEKRTGTTDLEKLGGLARYMPVTFVAMIVAAFSISGVPPFNGFVSKWLVYQGMLEGGYMIFLVIAIFGSALTLASFIKVLHSLFLGRLPAGFERVREVDFTMQFPMILLALLCILFGVYAAIPLDNFIIPIVGGSSVTTANNIIETTQGFWRPGLATILVIIGIIVGLIIYAIGRVKGARVDENVWIGGNIMDNEEIRIPGTHFYKTVTEDLNPILTGAFRDGDRGAIDGYNIIGKLGESFVNVLRALHDGILSTYLSWVVIGLGVLVFIMMFH